MRPSITTPISHRHKLCQKPRQELPAQAAQREPEAAGRKPDLPRAVGGAAAPGGADRAGDRLPGPVRREPLRRLAGGDDGLHDQLRARQGGRAGLVPFAALDDSSDDKASDVIQCDEFSHTACGRPFTYWLEQDGYVQPGACWGAGENLAWGTGELGTVRSILTAWVNSPEHLANMLTASFDHFGVGMEVGPLRGYPDAHVWVTHFGSLC